MNNGKLSSQVLCKICGRTSPDRVVRDAKAKPATGARTAQRLSTDWKEDGICTAYKCPNNNCPFYVCNLSALTPEERDMRATGNTSQFKLRYLFREYHFASEDLSVVARMRTPVDLNRIHNNLHTVGLCLTFSVSFGLSARMTARGHPSDSTAYLDLTPDRHQLHQRRRLLN
jgi:putative transposase